MCYIRKLVYIPFLLFLLLAFESTPQITHTTFLDSVPFSHIINPYGPPKRNLSFGNDTMNINGYKFLRGLGTHAPAELNIDLQGKALGFTALVGIDREILTRFDPERAETRNTFPRYVYDNNDDHYDKSAGGTVIFVVKADGKTIFESEVMTVADNPLEINVSLKDVKQLTLVAKATADGSYNDHINWAEARISWNQVPPPSLFIYNYPRDVMVNHIGFVPKGIKTCYLWGTEPGSFIVIDAQTSKEVFKGRMIPKDGVLGNYLVGDFSEFIEPGNYYIKAGKHKSVVFEIAHDVYLKALHLNVNYINQQRSGHPTQGWAPGQHLDDGIRQDTWEHQDVSGGWYDGNDLRKATNGAVLLLFALANLAESNLESFDKMKMLDEIQWGNKFLHAMQEPEGYLMHYVGSTTDEWLDNRWTDNIVGTEDDRVILTRPAGLTDQMIFALTNAKIGYIYNSIDSTYADKCLSAAIKAWNWAMDNHSLTEPELMGIAVASAVNLYSATKEKKYKLQAVDFANQLLAMQQEGDEYLKNHFFTFTERARTYKGRWTMMGLQIFVKNFPDHELAKLATNAMKSFAEGYFLPLSTLNAFGNVAWVFATKSLGSDKTLGGLHYRNFLHVGMNQHLSSVGCAASAVFDLTKNQEYLSLAQKQIDWIYGANPFNSSTVTGLGYNQPALFKTSEEEFRPHTPEIDGGVMTGIGSDPEDNIALYPGWWWTTEYWAPSVTYTMLFTIMLQQQYQN